jgi:hypothetical protein
MKTFITKLLALCSVALLLLPACKKDGTLVTATGGKAGTLSSTVTAPLVLDKTKLNDPSPAITFSVTAPNYGFSAAVTNTLQIDAAGDNWVNPTSFTLGAKVLTHGFATADFNALLLKLSLPAYTASQVQVRMMHSISATIAPVYSNVLSLTVTPFNLTTYLWTPGAYQGWTPSTSFQLTSPTSNNIYNGIVNFTGSDLNFKVTSDPDWNHTNYGAGATAGTISSTGGNLLAPADGGILLTVNLATSTIVFTPQWSIIGDATPGGWGSDTNMLYKASNDTWYITAKLVSDGGQAIKFRFKNDWTINLGGSGGTLSQGGANITIPNTTPAGANYAITLDANAKTYTLVKQ